MIRKARKEDVQRIIELLHQVNMVHHVIRPDLFKPHTTKYNGQELGAMLNDDSTFPSLSMTMGKCWAMHSAR